MITGLLVIGVYFVGVILGFIAGFQSKVEKTDKTEKDHE